MQAAPIAEWMQKLLSAPSPAPVWHPTGTTASSQPQDLQVLSSQGRDCCQPGVTTLQRGFPEQKGIQVDVGRCTDLPRAHIDQDASPKRWDTLTLHSTCHPPGPRSSGAQGRSPRAGRGCPGRLGPSTNPAKFSGERPERWPPLQGPVRAPLGDSHPPDIGSTNPRGACPGAAAGFGAQQLCCSSWDHPGVQSDGCGK